MGRFLPPCVPGAKNSSYAEVQFSVTSKSYTKLKFPRPQSFMGAHHAWSTHLAMAAPARQWRRPATVTQTAWPAEPKPFAIQSFT